MISVFFGFCKAMGVAPLPRRHAVGHARLSVSREYSIAARHAATAEKGEPHPPVPSRLLISNREGSNAGGSNAWERHGAPRESSSPIACDGERVPLGQWG